MNNKILIFGHKNPDTDSICSAISLAKLKELTGVTNILPCRLGDISKETEFVLSKFSLEKPYLISSVEPKTEVILVDHNEAPQSVDGIKEAKIIQVVDHHKFANFETDEPVKINADIVGCSCTIIYELYKQEGVIPPKEIAGIMMSAILSDTLLFKSPTCTEKDIKAVKELSKISGIEDFESYGMEMLIAGTSLSDKTPEEILKLDGKEFEIMGKKVSISQVNTVDMDGVLSKSDELKKAMNEMNSKNNYEFSLLIITDIIKAGSNILAIGNVEPVEKAFNVKLNDNIAWLEGVVSRKKQVVPFLMKN